MDRFASEAEGRIQEFSQQNLANMAWAFGKLTHDAPSLLDAIGLKATAIVKVAVVCFRTHALESLLNRLCLVPFEICHLPSAFCPSPFACCPLTSQLMTCALQQVAAVLQQVLFARCTYASC